MEYRLLGKTGLKVSQLCFGTMSFGAEADETVSAEMFHRCRDAGINFFDCANVYSQGRAETILSDLIADCRAGVKGIGIVVIEMITVRCLLIFSINTNMLFESSRCLIW